MFDAGKARSTGREGARGGAPLGSRSAAPRGAFALALVVLNSFSRCFIVGNCTRCLLTDRANFTCAARSSFVRYDVRLLSDYFESAGLGDVPPNQIGMIEQVLAIYIYILLCKGAGCCVGLNFSSSFRLPRGYVW